MQANDAGFSNFILDANMVPYPAYTYDREAGCCWAT